MTDTKLKALVTEAVDLDRMIAQNTDRLAELKSLLVAEAVSREEQQTKTDGGGWSLTMEGTNGCIARVTQPGPKLKSSVDAEKPAGAKLMALVGKFKDQLFTPRLTYVPVENFRDKVANLFGGQARKIISACEGKASPQVAFETKEAA